MCHSLGPLVRSDEIMRVKGCRYISFQDAGAGTKESPALRGLPGAAHLLGTHSGSLIRESGSVPTPPLATKKKIGFFFLALVHRRESLSCMSMS